MSSASDDHTPLPTRSRHAAPTADGEPELPTRVPRSRPSGRHRRPEAPQAPEGAPPLLLAVPGPDGPAIGSLAREVAFLARGSLPGLDIRPVVIDEGATDLTAIVLPPAPEAPAAAEDGGESEAVPAAEAEAAPAPEVPEGPLGVLVPLLLGPDAEVSPRVARAARSAGPGRIMLTDALGPHPLLAEAVHERLSEAGLARADRARLFTVATAADGIVLAVPGGPAAVASAEVTGVLLAARLALPVVTVDLDTPGAVEAAAGKLRGMGATTLALAPYALGPELDTDRLATEAAAAGCTAAGPIGAHQSVAQLIITRYLEALGLPTT